MEMKKVPNHRRHVKLLKHKASVLHARQIREPALVSMECWIERNVAVPMPAEDKGDLDYWKEGTIKLVDQVKKVKHHH